MEMSEDPPLVEITPDHWKKKKSIQKKRKRSQPDNKVSDMERMFGGSFPDPTPHENNNEEEDHDGEESASPKQTYDTIEPCDRCGEKHWCTIHETKITPRLCKKSNSLYLNQYIVSCPIFDHMTKTFCTGCKFSVCELPTNLNSEGEEKKVPCARCKKVFYAHGRNMTSRMSHKKKPELIFHACDERIGLKEYCKCIPFVMCKVT